MRLWPRSIRWQMLAGLILLEALSIFLFDVLLIRQQKDEALLRAKQRLMHQADSVCMQAKGAIEYSRPEEIALSVRMMGNAPSVAYAKITDTTGRVLYASQDDPSSVSLNEKEHQELAKVHFEEPHVFSFADDRWEGIKAIYISGHLQGYAIVETDHDWDHQQSDSAQRAILIFGMVWLTASALLVLLMSSSITKPIRILHAGTRALMHSPEDISAFPLPVTVHNEIGDLMEAFNRMVASIVEQRSGLNDTLSLLDSMLANAPIGLAFFDRRCRFVRVNQVFAGMTGIPLGRHLGRTLPELFPQPVASELEDAVLRVFHEETPVHELELNGVAGQPPRSWSWLASAYPVRPVPEQVRWVGVIVIDSSEHKRSEEALRKSEKLAATGRLAASIAHEINNPLEAITNLLFLLRNFCQLDPQATGYVEMAEHEAQRIAEITQQTLRFYRQSTLPARANMADLLDSVLSLFSGRLSTHAIVVTHEYDPAMDLFCFAGEIRQVFANLIGNAIDASTQNGRLIVRARRSRNWNTGQQGVRFTVADTGCGMEPHVRQRIFEAFFTTKEITGTGLGLWVSQEIIQKHHGLIHVRSRAAHANRAGGTVFEIFLPDDESLTAAPPETAH
jgi:signal transduction histidine kinase